MENNESRYEYNKKYVKKYLKESVDEIKLRLPKGEKEKIKAHAEDRGESVNGFISRAISETMTRDLYVDTDNVSPEKWEAAKKIIDRNRAERYESPHPTPNQIQKIKELKEQRKKQGE